MAREDKTKEELIEEIKLLQKRITELGEFDSRRKKEEAQARVSKIHLSDLTKYANDLIILLDDNFCFLETNERVIDNYGYTREELMGMHATQLRAPEVKGLFAEQIKPVHVTGRVVYETVHQRKDETKFPVEISLRAINTEEKRFYHAVVRDITERKKSEEALRSSEEKLRAIFDNAKDGILLVDAATKQCHTGNNTICQMLGYSLDEIKDLRVTDIHPKEDVLFIIEQFERLVRREISLAEDLPMKRKDGSVFYADINASLITLAGRTHLLGVFRDITERKKIEDELIESEIKYKTLFENLNAAILLADVDTGMIIDANKNAEGLLGRSRQEIIGIDRTLIHPSEEVEYYKKHFQDHVEKGEVKFSEAVVVKKDGTRVPVQISAAVTEIQGKKMIQGIFQDITARKKMEEDARKRLQELEVFYKASIGREERIIELKKEIEMLTEGLGK